MTRSPAQRAQMRRINPYMGRKAAISSSSSGPSWWLGLSREEFAEEAKKQEARRQQESGRVIFPNREDVA